MTILVTGGAGYIGGYMVRMLLGEGHSVVVLDTLERGFRQAVPSAATLVVGNVGDKKTLASIFSKRKIDAVMHFAGYTYVEESMRQPLKYFRNNVVSPLALLEMMEEQELDQFIFSSSAAVYGNPVTIPIPEGHANQPTNYYGLSKWSFEELLRFFDRRGSIRSISLRYFNAAGAAADGSYGESHQPETHLIPSALEALLGRRTELAIYGTDYQTSDGTAVRDFIHLEDLCRSHLLALEALSGGHKTDVFNVGAGRGASVREVVAAIEKVSGRLVPTREVGRRAGDPAQLIADPTKLTKEFGWKPKYSDLNTIVGTAWKWHQGHPDGYK